LDFKGGKTMENEKINIIQNYKRMTTKQLIMCALFTALITVGAFIKIPVPVVPFTLQFLFTMMAGLLLGGEIGAYSVFIYILFGLMGLPIFSEGGGIGYIFKPSFGYIIGFCIASYVTGKIVNKISNPTYKRILTANFIGLAIVYSIGMLYYYIICNFIINTPIGVWPLFLYCFILAVPGDILLCILSAHLYKRLIPVIKIIRS
jgi:biotin transport system substrate-specific component